MFSNSTPTRTSFTFWQADLGEVVGAVHAILLAAVAVALSGQKVAAAPASQRHEPLVLKQLLLCHIHAAAALALHQDRIC